jgi:hypothetical protein
MALSSRILKWVLILGLSLGSSGAAQAASEFGKLSGVVVDPAGTPQMGASVTLLAERPGSVFQTQLFTNQRGAFADPQIAAGLYEVHVTLAGFLPSVQHDVRVIPNLNTLVHVELNTVFASLDRLRHGPEQQNGADDWKWTLRASAATRPVLQWVDANDVQTVSQDESDSNPAKAIRALFELTSGSDHPGSLSNAPDAPGSAAAYDLSAGSMGRLLMAGEVSYARDFLPATSLAAIWVPLGDVPDGPVTELVVRQTPLNGDGFSFRGVRLDQHNTFAIGDHVKLHYGAEFVAASLDTTTESIRPSADLDVRFNPDWVAHLLVASELGSEMQPQPSLDGAIGELNSFPILLRRDGRSALEDGWHEEIGIQHKFTERASVEAAAFHDRSRDTAVFGRGALIDSSVLPDPYTDAFVYDAGASESWGSRVAYKEKLTDNLDLAAVYAFAGSMSPTDLLADGPVQGALQMRYRHSVAMRMSGKVHRTGTEFIASYKWLSGSSLTQQDAFGEALYDLDPYLNITIRQQLPIPGSFWSGRWQALAEVRNLLAQGYVAMPSQDGQLLLTPICRSFRGGLSFQF